MIAVLALLAGLSAPPASTEPIQTYVILIGYPVGPAGEGLPTLTAVEEDVEHMHTFFEVLHPQATYVHLATNQTVDGITPRPPTFQALKQTVAELTKKLDTAQGETQIYVYFAGHGKRYRAGDISRTRIFMQPVAGGKQAGDDGRVDSKLLSELVLDPLSAHATVHLIIDACQSYFLLETRGLNQSRRVYKRPPRIEYDLMGRFTSRHPKVGALTATNGDYATFEDPAIGGVFSYAVRSAALGQADTNKDGVTTYAEVGSALTKILAGRAGSGQPGVAPPQGTADAPFIDYRGTDAARITFTPEVATRYELLDTQRTPHAVIHPPQDQSVILYLPPGQDYYVIGHGDAGQRTWWRLPAQTGQFTQLREPLGGEITTPRGPLQGLLPDPLQTTSTLKPPRQPWAPRSYFSAGAVGVIGHLIGDGLGKVGTFPGVDLVLTTGAGLHHLTAALGWRRLNAERNGDFTFPFQVDIIRGVVGYGWNLADGLVEWSIGPSLGLAHLIQTNRNTEDDKNYGKANRSWAGEGWLTTSLRLPIPSRAPFAFRLDLAGGVQALLANDADRTWVLSYPVEIKVGAEWEFPVD